MAAASFKHIGSLAFIFVIFVLFLLLLEGVLPVTERKQLIAGVGSDGSDERGEGVAVPDGRVSLHVQNTRTLPLLPQVHSQYAGQPEREKKTFDGIKDHGLFARVRYTQHICSMLK